MFAVAVVAVAMWVFDMVTIDGKLFIFWSGSVLGMIFGIGYGGAKIVEFFVFAVRFWFDRTQRR